jgi:5-methylcytosine-specific restriction enzyme B
MTTDALDDLVDIIRSGRQVSDGAPRSALTALFGHRFPKAKEKDAQIRDAFGLARSDGDDAVPYAGLINPDNPPSGPYGGTSVVWFPAEHESLICLVVGTRGLSPDEGILTRPGHRRRIAALRRYLARLGVSAWSKPDPAALGTMVPKVVTERFPEWEPAIRKYGAEMYCFARVPSDQQLARSTVQAFIDLYALERGWRPLKDAEREYDALHGALRQDLFRHPSTASVNSLIRERRFVILQGPPGTGKTRLAEEVRQRCFNDRGMTVQFHPSITYEDFVIGLSPRTTEGGLQFGVRPGSLLQACENAADQPFLLVIDEINRADLSKVLGEAIFLFETAEVGGTHARHVRLPHPFNGTTDFSIPENLYVVATMNTADRSIAPMDLAIRRRFSFVNLPPDRSVLVAQGNELALKMFDRLTEVFVEHAPDDGIDLLPGHAYFLGSDDQVLRQRFRHELLPLLDDYLRQGVLGSATAELYAVRDQIEDEVNSEAA